MSIAQEPAYLGTFPTAADAPAVARVEFIRKTYAHLAGAILAFVGLEAALLSLPGIERVVGTMLGGRFSWLIVLGAFILVSSLAEKWARSATSLGTQYMGLTLYIVAEAVVFLPLLYVAARFGGPDVIPTAALITAVLFTGLSAVVLLTKKDFSFLRGILCLAGFAALGFMICGVLFNFTLGNAFTVAMIAFAGGYVLYDTSNVIHHYRIGQHVSAALALFASVALMFWYVLRLVMRGRN